MDTEEKRSPEKQGFVDMLAKSLYGRSQTSARSKSVCVMCGKPLTPFRDELSVREYAISGMCQTCQDGVFDESDNDEPDPELSKDSGDV